MLVSEDRNGALAGHMDKNSGVGKFGNVTAAAYNASRRNDPELAAIYNQTLSSLNKDDSRQVSVMRDGRRVNLNVDEKATDYAQSYGVKDSVDSALAKVHPDAYKVLLNAAFQDGNIASVGISGGFRPTEAPLKQSRVHPEGRGLDYNNITMNDGTVHKLNRNGFDGSRESSIVKSFNQNLYNQPHVTEVKVKLIRHPA